MNGRLQVARSAGQHELYHVWLVLAVMVMVKSKHMGPAQPEDGLGLPAGGMMAWLIHSGLRFVR